MCSTGAGSFACTHAELARTLLVGVVDDELAYSAYHLREGFMSPRESLEFACRPGRRV